MAIRLCPIRIIKKIKNMLGEIITIIITLMIAVCIGGQIDVTFMEKEAYLDSKDKGGE